MTEQEVSSSLAALQSVCNLLDWEQQTATVTGKSCGQSAVSEPLKLLRRRLIIGELGKTAGSKKRTIPVTGDLGERKEAERYQQVSSPTADNQGIKQPESGQESSLIETAVSRELAKMREQENRLTNEEAVRQAELTREAGVAWERCRQASSPKQSSFYQSNACEQEYLEILDAQIKLLKEAVKKTDYEQYLLDYEPCYKKETIAQYLQECKRELRPLLVERLKKQRQEPPIWQPKEHYTPERQRKLAQFLSEYLGFDASKGKLGESVHPFTTAFNRDCVYWSDHYETENPFAGIFTALHETGHALYEQNLGKELSGTVLAGGCSSAMHEAIARFYENCIGRMSEFWKPIYGKVTLILGGEFERLPFLEFMRRIRQVKPGCIRTEADELTYPYHILLRYELEQALFSGEVSVQKLPEEWNKRMYEYLGVEPKQAQEGYLQDIHWSCGQFGYFPAYQTGNAIAAQIYRRVQEVLPLPELLLEGRLGQLKRYLATYIFRYGLVKNTEELLIGMTGEPLRFRYYLEYLKERYGADATV
ncbi:MAG: carboxypeptidase M32 [Lachnospiraceae bacterium]|jgi:carboxypeptidase Taq|nr:carboxypeptidase M32 [Lachnospiraceae bacterium]